MVVSDASSAFVRRVGNKMAWLTFVKSVVLFQFKESVFIEIEAVLPLVPLSAKLPSTYKAKEFVS